MSQRSASCDPSVMITTFQESSSGTTETPSPSAIRRCLPSPASSRIQVLRAFSTASSSVHHSFGSRGHRPFGQLSPAWMTHTFRHRRAAHENRPGFGCDQILMARLHSTSAGSTAQGDRLLLLPGRGLGVRVVWIAGHCGQVSPIVSSTSRTAAACRALVHHLRHNRRKSSSIYAPPQSCASSWTPACARDSV
jgi:hypothetical protein